MRVLVTRPEPEASALGERLEQLGHTVLLEPLLTIELLDPPWPDMDTIQAVLVTSGNALRSLAHQPKTSAALTGKPIFVVGPATAALARQLGFVNIVEGAGTAADLVGLIGRHLQAGHGSLLALSGAVATLDFAQALAEDKFVVHAVTMYRARPAAQLQPETLAAMTEGQIDAVTLLSTRTAQTYATLVARHGQQENMQNVVHLCLSASIAQALKPLRLSRIAIARDPNIEELLALTGGDDKCLP